MLTQDELKRIFHYEPATGLFTRLAKTGTRVNIGDIAQSHNGEGYIQIGINKLYYRAHRLAFLYVTGKWPDIQCDHINGIRDDNRWDNLRQATEAINAQNTHGLRADNTSGYAGVTWDKQKRKWDAQIKLNSKTIHLGLFDCKHQAGAYRLHKKRELHPGCTV